MSSRRRPRPAFRFEKLEDRRLLAADITLVKDTEPGYVYGTGRDYTAVGDKLFFGFSPGVRPGLWVTDGSYEGTQLILPTTLSTLPKNMLNVNGTLYFTVDSQLWKSDGTEAGTVKITAGCCDSLPTSEIAEVNGVLYFRSSSLQTGSELWKTTPATSTATMVKDILPGTLGSVPRALTNYQGQLYFSADHPTLGRQIWKSDGTEAGTVVLPIAFGAYPENLLNVQGTLFFTAKAPGTGRELWKSDGAAHVMVKDLTPGSADSSFSGKFATLGNQIVFQKSGLWKSDGTDAGTTLIHPVSSVIETSIEHNGRLYLAMSSGNGTGWWVTDGTTAGTYMLRAGTPLNVYASSNIAYAVFSVTGGTEMWRSDGTVAGTGPLFPSGAADPLLAGVSMTEFRGKLTFGAVKQSDGGIWQTDGTAASTQLLTRLIERGIDGNLSTVRGVDHRALFNNNRGLWITDGSTDGTVLLNSTSHLNHAFTPLSLGNQILFASGTVSELKLWSTDGTPAGTRVINVSGVNLIAFQGLFRIGNRGYFVGYDTVNKYALWTSDGSDAGTQLVKVLGTGNAPFLQTVGGWVTLGSDVFFYTELGDTKTLWRTDGTSAGTVLVKSDFKHDKNISLAVMNGSVYAIAETTDATFGLWRIDGVTNAVQYLHGLDWPETTFARSGYAIGIGSRLVIRERNNLWVSDGTSAGTNKLRSFDSVSGIGNFIEFQGKVYFNGNDGVTGVEPWVTDGTLAGTRLVKDIIPGITFADRFMATFRDKLLFLSNDQIYLSDGTTDGTLALPTPKNSPIQIISLKFASGFADLGDQFVFIARDELHDNELFTYATTDHGDAPTGTRIVDYGPAHIDIGPMLGTRRDTNEIDGRPAPQADGDDGHDTDDEDGLVTMPALNVGATSELEFQVSSATPQSKLWGWFDWNLDGDWNEANELMIAGVSVTNGTNRISITVPGQASNGLVQARFRISDQTTLGPLGLATSGEVEDYAIKMGEDLIVDLASTSSNNVVVRRSGADLQVVDAGSSTIFASRPLNRLAGVTIRGRDNEGDRIKLDYSQGFFGFPGGLQLEGRGGVDALEIVGGGITSIKNAALPGTGQSQLLLSSDDASGWVRFSSVEELQFKTLKQFELSGVFDVGSRTITIDSSQPVELGSSTTINGGQLIATAVHLSAGDVLVGQGQVRGQFTADSGSQIRLTGQLELGDSNSTSGFSSLGNVETDGHRLILLDADSAQLGGQVSLGSLTVAGTLQADQGLTLSANAVVTGSGTINTPNSASQPLVHAGGLRGRGPTGPIVLKGYVIGSGTLDNVTIEGTYAPGPGTVAITHGSVLYTGQLILEVAGTVAGSQHDQLNHTGSATLGGQLTLQSLASFVPDVNTRLNLLNATTEMVGNFASISWPAVPAGQTLQRISGQNVFTLEVVQLTLTVAASTLSEKGGTTTGTIARSGSDRSQALVVQLTSNDLTELTVPASVTIPAGQSSINFTITAVDDALLDGTQEVTVAAVATEYAPVTQILTVTDSEALLLNLSASSMSELDGRVTGTVTRENTDRDLPLVVQLSSSDVSQAVVPATVTIPAGAASVGFEVTAIDDTLLDGTKSIQIGAMAEGYLPSTRSVEVLDSEQLTLVATRTRVSEFSDSLTITVSRSNTDNGLPLTVGLQSSLPAKAPVPSTVVIPAGATSVEFVLTPTDDAVLNGEQVAEITASAAGYVAAAINIVIEDYEPLSVTLQATSMSERFGSINGSVARNASDISRALEVRLSVSDASEAAVPETVTIPAGSSSVAFVINATDDRLLDGLQSVVVRADAVGYVQGSANFGVTDFETLALTLAVTSVFEDVGTVPATITRSNTDVDQELVVTLSTNRTDLWQVPTTFTIPAGQSSASLDIAVLDNDLLDGTRTASLTVRGDGYQNSTANLQIKDSERLTIQLPLAEAKENAEPIQATVTRSNTNIGNALVVSLQADDTSEAIVPAQVTIPANQASVSFTITLQDDALLDGAQSVNFSATASGYVAGVATLAVLDFEQLQLTVDQSTISELNGTATGTVRRNNTDRAQPLVVTLASSDPARVNLPASVTIPAGANSATFAISAVDNDLLEGLQSLSIAAMAGGYEAASVPLSVSDSETIRLTLATGSVSEAAGTVSAVVARSNTNQDLPLTVTIQSSNQQRISLPATVVIPAGSTELEFTVTIINDTVYSGDAVVGLVARATGYVDGTANLTVTEDERQLPWQNPRNRLDVNNDRFVTAFDALLIINAINNRFQLTPQPPANPEFLDVSGDNALSAIDALLVINALNNPGQAEGEMATEADGPRAIELTIDMLAEDIRKYRERAGRFEK